MRFQADSRSLRGWRVSVSSAVILVLALAIGGSG